jgi:hypothetical protein
MMLRSCLSRGLLLVPLLALLALPVDAQWAPQKSEEMFWNSIKDSRNPADFQDYLTRFPRGMFATLAQARYEALRNERAALAPPQGIEPPLDKNALGRDARGGAFSCSMEHSLKSLTSEHSVTVTFTNLSSRDISTYWLNYAGNRVFYKRVDPGSSYTQQTYISHPWVLVDSTGRCRKIILPGSSQAVVTIP